ncbi:MAG: hypothetical protein JO011_06815 [Ktedonobacteraceae bacterium]|nr:hypothetical protein [Ktedonobacteraceae bacterium]
MKYLKLTIYELIALGIIVASVIIRLVLMSQNWPWTDSDEGTFGIMALHIAYQGAHPIFVYGQIYMGTLQAYLGAGMFHIFGPSLFSLRLGVLLLFVLFLVSLYLLTRTLYSRGLALVTIAILSLGSNYLLTYQLRMYGGYADTLLFGTLIFLIASWLAISSKPQFSFRSMSQRSLAFAAWGLVVGLSLWSDDIVLPFIAMAGLLLLLFCWRELLRIVALLSILLGLAVGMFPLIIYNLHAAPGQDSITTLLKLQNGSNGPHSSLTTLLHRAAVTFQVSISTMTGNPFCPVSEEATLRDPTSPHTLSCTIIHSSWSLGYTLLFACAFVLAAWMTYQAWQSWRNHKGEYEKRQNLARHTTSLLLLCSAILTVLLYLPGTATNWPGTHARYIIGLLIATPVVLWPLWKNARMITHQASKLARTKSIASTLVIAIVGIFYLIGTIIVLTEIPTAQTYNQQDQVLIARLESIGATHIYGGYWTCDKLTFLSQEKIICGVIFGNLRPAHNRYQRYYDIVKADPHSAYVFPESDYKVVIKHRVEQNPAKYHVQFVEGFYIVQPI